MIDDVIESKFEKDILKIFNCRVIIENFLAWEKIIEIFIINERFAALKTFIIRILESISCLKCDNQYDTYSVKDTLYLYLHSVICRTFSLVWKKQVKDIIVGIYDSAFDLNNVFYYIDIYADNYYDAVKLERQHYCQTCMNDKSVMPIMFSMLNRKEISDEGSVNLTKFNEVLRLAESKWKSDYKYYPYMMNMYDFSMITCIEQFQANNPFEELVKMHDKQTKRYIESNYNLEGDTEKSATVKNLISVKKFCEEKNLYQISVGKGKKPKLRIAIANVKLEQKNLEKLIKDMPNRSYARYRDLSSVVNQAIDQHSDMLVMPELFIPFEWLSTVARTCAKNDLAIVTGIEYVKFNSKIFNLTAVILPYTEEKHKCAHISFHLKKHYAPVEIEEIVAYRLAHVDGKNYELYKWNDCYFPVYCCYELASIVDRSIFQSYADLLVAVEWNKDVKYYSNILESLSRDIHCYCVQVNTSEYGDSRITLPTRSESKDIVKTKGGINCSILVDEIDIEKLRDFQAVGYELQKGDGRFKITPPEFNKDVTLEKIKGEKFSFEK